LVQLYTPSTELRERAAVSSRPPTIEQIEAELDARLLSVWLQAWETDEWDIGIVGPFLRLAYGTGYRDALTESRRGTLYKTIGQAVPARQRGD
jgi:hypothetical protein